MTGELTPDEQAEYAQLTVEAADTKGRNVDGHWSTSYWHSETKQARHRELSGKLEDYERHQARQERETADRRTALERLQHEPDAADMDDVVAWQERRAGVERADNQGPNVGEVAREAGVDPATAAAAIEVNNAFLSELDADAVAYWNNTYEAWPQPVKSAFTKILADPANAEDLVARLPPAVREDLLHARSAMPPHEWEHFKASLGRPDLRFH